MFNKSASRRFSADPGPASLGKLLAVPMHAAFLICALLSALSVVPVVAQSEDGPTETLHGHVLEILPKAKLLPRNPAKSREPLRLTVVLKFSDEAGFDAYRKDVDDPKSPNFRKLISRADLAARFGPTQQEYDSVLAYLKRKGFTLVAGTANRLAFTVRGTRAQAESAFHVPIDDYRLGSRSFHAIAAEPAVPAPLAPLIAAVSGLSNLARPRVANSLSPPTAASIDTAYDGAPTKAGSTNHGGLPPGLDGSGETIGLIEIDNYVDSDVKHWLHSAKLPSKLINQISRVPVAGGTSPSGCKPGAGCGTSEALLDIAAALGTAPGANIIVFVGPYGTDLLEFANAAVAAMDSSGGVVSYSVQLCENEITTSEAKGMDNLLTGYSETDPPVVVFASTGDLSSTCNGSQNTISYPADEPHAIAVGGTQLTVSAGNSYWFESMWWNSTSSGSAFGLSQIFPSQKYQARFPSATSRSIPDVVISAFPDITICQAFGSKSPNCSGQGGTSLSAPLWAGIWALGFQAERDAAAEFIFGNTPFLYALPAAVFHPPGDMTRQLSQPENNFSTLGLGSPFISHLIAQMVAPYTSVDSISPSSGAWGGGTKVTVNGKGFVDVKAVTFGGVNATNVTIDSESQLTADSPPAPAGQVDVRVVTSAATTAKISKDVFVYDVPSITGVNPNTGPLVGEIVGVNGERLSDNLKFDFGGSYATGEFGGSVYCPTSTACTMMAPAHAAGPVDVIIESGSMKSSANSKDKFTYQAPEITKVSPAIGPTVGGQTVLLTGVGFGQGTTVKFGDTIAGIALDCPSDVSCSVGSPAGAGPVFITATVGGVTSPIGAGNLYNYEIFPTVASLSIYSGPVTGGIPVTITGTNFSTAPGGTTIMFGSQPATNVTCVVSTQCTVVAPLRAANAGFLMADVTATVGGNTSLEWVGFAFGTLPPKPPTPPGPKPQ
jgi:hypothetical protein